MEKGQKINLKDISFNVETLPSKPLPWPISGVSISPSAAFPKISVSDLSKITPHDLLKIDPGTEIVGFNFSIDNLKNDITETKNIGSKFNNQTAELIRNAHDGNTIMIENIRIIQNNSEIKIPSKVYYVVN